MQFKGKIRWSQADEQDLYAQLLTERQLLSADYLRRSVAADHWDSNVVDLLREFYFNRFREVSAKVDPFFGRVDISFDSETLEPRYIGYSGHESQEVRVVDWRAPIASLYYSARLGEATYDAPRGVVSVFLSLRRAFRDHGKIAYTINLPVFCYRVAQIEEDPAASQEGLFDEYLQEILNKPSEGLMRDIVRTIATEQDAMIRTSSKTLIIAGGPGTGKSAVMLHRIAYLDYTLQQQKQRQIRTLYVAPNPILAGSALGVFRHMESSIPNLLHIDGLVNQVLGSLDTILGIKVSRSEFAFVDMLDAGSSSEGAEQLRIILNLHNSFDFISLIEEFGIKRRMRFASLLQRRVHKFKKDIDHAHSLTNRLRSEIDLWMNRSINSGIKREFRELRKFCDELVSQLGITREFLSRQINMRGDAVTYVGADFVRALLSIIHGSWQETLEEKTRKISSHDKDLARVIIEPVSSALRELKLRWNSELTEAINEINPLQWSQYFKNECEEGVFQHLKPEEKEYLQSCTWQKTSTSFDCKVLMLLISMSVFGSLTSGLEGYDVVALDEIQNYPLSLMHTLKLLIPDSIHLILCGDPNQALLFMNSSLQQAGEIFDAHQYNLIKSYRSNPLIIEFATKLSNNLGSVQPVRRRGIQPEFVTVRDDELQTTIHSIALSQRGGTIAVITKNKKDAEELVKSIDIPLINGNSPVKLLGTFIIPLSLCSGLEFDTVVLYRVSRYDLDTAEERLRLYTAATRAMHRLYIHDVDPHSQNLQRLRTYLSARD